MCKYHYTLETSAIYISNEMTVTNFHNSGLYCQGTETYFTAANSTISVRSYNCNRHAASNEVSTC